MRPLVEWVIENVWYVDWDETKFQELMDDLDEDDSDSINHSELTTFVKQVMQN